MPCTAITNVAHPRAAVPCVQACPVRPCPVQLSSVYLCPVQLSLCSHAQCSLALVQPGPVCSHALPAAMPPSWKLAFD